MADYAGLVSVLRECSKLGTRYGMASIYMGKAADAIEELLQIAQHYEEESQGWWLAACDYKEEMEKHRWIPVTEEPPLKVGDDGYNGYLVFANGYYEVADYTTDKFGNAEYFHVNGEYEPDVTHGMPLPEPPKEEQT